MLKEALESLSKQAVSAAGPNFKEIDPTKSFAVTKPDGTVDIIGNAVPWRRHKAKDLETIAAFADKFKSGAVWVSRVAIAFLTDDADRRERVTIDMIQSKEIKLLADLEAKQPTHDQRSFLTMLRTVFTQEALPKFPKLIDVLRQVKFEASAKADGNIQRGKSSIGKSLTVETSFIEQVPEQVTLSVPIFENAFATKLFDVQCALEIHEAEARLQLFPLPGEVEKAYAAAEIDLCAAIGALLGKDATVPVYYGQP